MKCFFVFLVLLFHSLSAFAVQYYTVDGVTRLFYPEATTFVTEHKTLSAAQIQELQTQLKQKEIKPQWDFIVAKKGKDVLGYMLVDSVLGKERLFTYAVNFSKQGTVKGVELLVYRESHGSQIKNPSFRKQFVGKKSTDTIKVGKDIRSVSGATISSKSIAMGVKRALLVWNCFYR